MRALSRPVQIFLTVASCGLVFELVAFSDFDGAWADDLALLEQPGSSTSGSTLTPPPNIVFLFDSSGSMNNLICENYSDDDDCDKDDTNGLVTRSAPNSATVCEHDVLEAVTGKDLDSNGTPDEYRPLYETDGVTFQGSSYAIFDARKSSPGDDYFVPWTTFSHSKNNPWTKRYEGSGATDQAKFDDAIASECRFIADCDARSRCIYSLRTQGYFWERSWKSCKSGNPLGLTCKKALGESCSNDNECESDECTSSRCSECGNSGDCSGSCNSAGDGCPYAYCDYSVCGGYRSLSDLGDSCSADTDCYSHYCNGSLCAECDNNGDCTGGSCNAADTDCSYAYCDDSTCPGGPGGSTGATSSGTGVPTRPIFLGDYLNFYPPKGISLVKAFTDTINNMTGDARMGVSDFGDVGTGGVAFDVKPPCSQSKGTNCFDGDPDTVCFNPSNAQLDNYLYNTLEFDGRTPLAKALDNVGVFYTTATGANTPICDYADVSGVCGDGNNFVVLISDGLPSSDADEASDLPHSNGHIDDFSDSYFADNNEFVDDVAKALTQIDHRDIDDIQNVATYTVSFGMLNADDPTQCVGLMEQTATAGGGSCLPANSVDELRSALTEILNAILKRTRGFTAPATPTTRYSSSTFLSTAVFRPSITFPLWEGHVFGLKMCDETLGDDCNCDEVGSTVDVCVLDANGHPMAYDDEGYLTSEPYWDAQLCLTKDPDNPPDADADAGPDQNNLTVTAVPSGCFRGPDDRLIYTAIDIDSSGTLTRDDTKIAFTTDNVDDEAAFLAALNTGGDVDDAKEIVNFYRGYDTGDFDGDSNTTEPRNLETMRDGSNELVDGWWVLGDIFHSIPNVIERPTGRGLGSWGTKSSYVEFAADNDDRIKTMLVGANDGMVHAFHSGAWDSDDEAYDQGTGEEMWAFVSPEMLPKLKDTCDPTGGGCGVGNHRFLVDASVMVRDIWIGCTAGNTDCEETDKLDASNKTLWRTVAIYGHRRGGKTYVALDVTDARNPVFLWQFPQPGSSQASLMGQSWLDTFPAPASMGPLLMQKADGTSYDRWVVLLSAGFDPLDAKGNALFIVDAYTGDVIWEVTKTSNGDDTDHMSYSFPATPIFYSRVEGISPYMAGIVAADHGGQLWHIPIPGAVLEASPSLTPEIVFRTTDPLVEPDGAGGNNDGTLDPNEYQPRPFFFAPTLTRMRGKVRVIIGTGDRDMLLPQGTLSPTDGTYGTECSSDNDCTDAGAVCGAGRCSECADNGDCSGSDTCGSTDCLHSFCSDSECSVTPDATLLSVDINDDICNLEQRIYAINLVPCADGSGGTEPCTESDLQEVDIDLVTPSNSTYSTEGSVGWYYALEPGEKVATPFEILGGYAMYTTFYPTVGCGRGTGDVCNADSKGDARLYARHYITGRALDWDADGDVTADEVVVSLGSGVPTAPAVSVGIKDNQATPTLVAGGSDSGLQTISASGMGMSLVTEILRFPVTKRLCELLH